MADHVREMMAEATASTWRRTSIGSVPVVRRMDARQVAQVGRNRRGRSPAGCAASRPRFGRIEIAFFISSRLSPQLP